MFDLNFKPCPFCGHKEIKLTKYYGEVYCYCNLCRAKGPGSLERTGGEESAIRQVYKDWNRRHDKSTKSTHKEA